jgi:hypothetical protein
MLAYVVTRNTCLGHVDSSSESLCLDGTDSNAWVRTCFFFLPRFVAGTLSPWVAHRDAAVFFKSPFSREFRPEAPLSLNYQAHITSWLEGRKIGGHEWHSPVASGPKEDSRFQRKTLAILNEHRLTIALRAAGVRLTDFCWLNSLREIPLANQPDSPSETDQLKIRRRILGIPEICG